MGRLLWLPEVLRAEGLVVHEQSGWKTRGSSTFAALGLICHATAGSSTSTDAGEIRVLLEGSTTAPPPIAQLYLSRSGAWTVIASGRCNHAKVGWAGPLEGIGNTGLLGIEAQNDNDGQPWPAEQLDSYQRGVAAICRRMGWTAARNVAAHREHQPYAGRPAGETSTKSDPAGIDMAAFRARVTALLLNGDGDDVDPDAKTKIDNNDKRMFALLDGAERVTLLQPGTNPPKSVVEDIKPNIRQREVADALKDLKTEVAKLVARPATPPPATQPIDYVKLVDELLSRVAAAPRSGG